MARATFCSRCRIEAADDEHDARATIVVRPRLHMHRRVDQMLDPMHRDRRIGAGDIQDAFHPQNLVAVAVQQHRQPHTEHGPVELSIEGEREGMDVVAVSVAIGSGKRFSTI